ncbi:MAG: hypothetical protein M5U07_22630 [Xanthobacteraceae bacterium]|nr:hypothetical protein [Xanthobacteraceae bacterium]
MIEDNARWQQVAGKNYDTATRRGCRERGCTPHVSQNNTNRRSAIDGRTTHRLSYQHDQAKRIESRSDG